MRIGEASRRSGVSAKMIRHYEAIRLLAPAQRHDNSYRDFDVRDVHDLVFIRRARDLGFSIEEIGRLLALWRDRERPSREVKDIALRHVADMEARIAAMEEMVATLRHLADSCAGDERPDCPILGALGRCED
ncbi:MAG: Cu(I)-responsive transcriptional regulator [Salinarimonadaceae bacterium]|nr:MAG: Cu(I)-responsive transcriptional regulator [Salinarimonadaceae bacterium]